MTPHCPHCQIPLTSSVVGLACDSCGRLYRYTDDPVDQHDHADPPGTAMTPDTQSATDEVPPREDQRAMTQPMIINHHASSHYRRRLQEREHQLERTELEAHYAPNPAPSEPTHHFRLDTAVGQTALSPQAGNDQAESPDFPVDSSETTPISDQSLATANDTPIPHDLITDNESLVEEHEPHKPSPHILDVASVAPEDTAPRAPHSPLDLREAEPDLALDNHPAQLPTSHSPSSAPYHTPQITHHAGADDPLAKADALLAAAATPQHETSNNSKLNIILAIGTVIILAIGSFVALTILRPPATTSTQTVTPNTASNTPTPAQTQSPSAKRDSQRKKDLNDIAVGLAAYQKSTGSYPSGSDISALQPLTTANPPYIEKITNDPLSDPSTNLIIKYNYSSDGKSYTLSATLENKNDPDAKNGLYILKN